MPVFAALRIRNESRWIEEVIRSIDGLCDEILILDDHSNDGTPDICESLGCTVFRNAVPWVNCGGVMRSDESAGKDFLLQKAIECVPEKDMHFLHGNEDSPYWVLAIDGDEVLAPGDDEILRGATLGRAHVYSLRILYLWNSRNMVRVDGVYRSFNRPSFFRLMNRSFRYQRTPWGNGANFHCSSIPQELLHHNTPSDARLLHLGYLTREDRIRKWQWYSEIDPNNAGEDCYRHCVQGDIPEVPADARLRWAGPLELQVL
jgi:glycosyltransferase involved in cell wall biosynthesis